MTHVLVGTWSKHYPLTFSVAMLPPHGHLWARSELFEYRIEAGVVLRKFITSRKYQFIVFLPEDVPVSGRKVRVVCEELWVVILALLPWELCFRACKGGRVLDFFLDVGPHKLFLGSGLQ